MPSESANWTSTLTACLETVEREFAGAAVPIVDHEIVRTSAADEFGVWLVCRNRAEQMLFRDSDLARFSSALRRRMLAAGFSEPAVAGLALRITSRDDMVGGRFPDFR